MKKLNSLSEDKFLRTLFFAIPCFFLAAALIVPDRGSMFSGLMQILTQPAKVSTNYFAVGGYSGTFLNTALVGFLCLGIYCLPQSKPNQKTVLAYLLVMGFTTWGINLLNIIPSLLGVCLYCWIKKKPLGTQVNAMLFSTGAAPLITDLFLRYPYQDVVGFRWSGVLLGTVVGMMVGISMPAGIEHSGKVHKDYDLYSAALPLGLISFMLQAVLYNAMGLKIPAAPGVDTLAVASRPIVNTLCLVLFGLCILCGLLLFEDSWKGFRSLLSGDNYKADFLKTYGPGPVLINMGLLGLTILLYYNLVGAPLNGVTLGCIFCVVSCCACGSTAWNVLPIMAGYVIGSFGLQWISGALGGDFHDFIFVQPIAVGLCFATGMTPICGRYGWLAGMGAGILHLSMVTVLPSLHGGFCLYNGGFTAALVCIIVVPQLERFFGENPREKKLQQKV